MTEAGQGGRGILNGSMSLARLTLVSEEEVLALPESMDRVELLDGEVIVTPSPSPWHQELLSRIVVALRLWARSHPGPVYVGLAPLDVRFGAGRILQPDAFVVLDRVDVAVEGPLARVPEICVEVLSTNRAHDRLTKRFVFATAGVRELWVVEPSGLIERWHGQSLNEAEEVREALRTTLLPGFGLAIEELFKRP